MACIVYRDVKSKVMKQRLFMSEMQSLSNKFSKACSKCQIDFSCAKLKLYQKQQNKPHAAK